MAPNTSYDFASDVAVAATDLKWVTDQLRLQGVMLESMATAVLVTDVTGTILWSNPAFTAISGYTQEEAVGRNPRFLQSGRHDRAFYRNLWQQILSGETWKAQLTNRRKDGRLYFGVQTITPVRAAGGKITHFVAVMNDVTELTNAREELRSTNEQLRATHEQLRQLIAQSPAITYKIGKGNGVYRLDFVSENIEWIFGHSPQDATSPNWWPEVIHPEDRAGVKQALDEAARCGSVRTEFRVRDQSGTYRWVEDTCRWLADRDGESYEFVGVWNDITERRRAEEAVRAISSERASLISVSPGRELGIIVASCVAIFVVGYWSGFFDWLFRIDAARHPLAEEAMGTLMFLCAGLAIFSYRRWRETRTEMSLQTRLAHTLHQLNRDMDMKVHLRTAELARNNETLESEIAERRRVERELRLFRAQVDHASDTIEVIDPETARFLDVNAKGPAEIGCTREEYLNLTVLDLERGIELPRWRELVETIRVKGALKGEGRHVRKDGSSFPIEYSARWVRLDRDYIVTCVRDISERYLAMEALHEQREQWRALITASASALFVLQAERFVFANPRMAGILDVREEDLMGRSVWEFVHDADHQMIRNRIRERAESAESLPPTETRFRRRDGSYIDVETTSVQFTYKGKAALLVEARDISRRKKATEELKEAEARFRQLAENVHEVFWLTSVEKHDMLYISPGYERIWGRTCASLYTAPRTWLDAIRLDDRAMVLAALDSQVAGGYDIEYRILRPDGSERWIRDRAFPVRNDRGEVTRIAGVAEDITDAKRSELRSKLQHAVTARLAEGESFVQTTEGVLQCLGESAGCVLAEFWSMDRASATLRCSQYWHPQGARAGDLMLQSKQLTFARGEGLPGWIWATKCAEWVGDVARDSRCQRQSAAMKAGATGWVGFPVQLRSEMVGVIGLFVTENAVSDDAMLSVFATVGQQFGQFIERQQLSEQFRQAQKMEAIGTLAGGIAHDFNNIIAGIVGYGELAKMESVSGSPVAEHLEAILKSGRRAADLVKQILAFSRQQEQQRATLQLRHIVSEALHLLRATIPSTIAFETNLARDLPTVSADPTQIHQVVMNLCTNAWHAMREHGGRLKVLLEPCQVDALMAERHAGLRPGMYVRLSVEDTGHGMNAATLARIFEPFFTTKAPGEGTGLGLSVVHGIMQSHEGVVTVYSQPGKGTAFRLYFPATPGASASVTDAAQPVPMGHGERILFVDDEEILTKMGKKTLERLGYVVEAHSNSLEALEMVRADPAVFDLVITDLTMPGITGIQLAEQLRAIRPDLPVILTTGYTANLTSNRIQELGLTELLLKPMSLQTLAGAVARVLATTN